MDERTQLELLFSTAKALIKSLTHGDVTSKVLAEQVVQAVENVTMGLVTRIERLEQFTGADRFR